MAKSDSNKTQKSSADQRRLRGQQIIFAVISILIILAMLLSFIQS
ncbi:MAG TPA: hypothetical protein PKD55_12705 [Bellilinea sp.]|nr:hypothetical protein [Bellilinea sp.]